MDVLIHKKYQDDLTRYLFKVYSEKTLCDTVIHTPDGGAFQCHKIIVTASSTYLHNVLSQASQVHSSFSVDVNATTLQVLLEYMYTGQLFVSELTRNAISEAATYLQIYPVLDLLKEVAVDNFATNKKDEDRGGKEYKEMSDTDMGTGYDSENTIVDDSEILASFSTLGEEGSKVAKADNKKLKKAKEVNESGRATKELQGGVETYTAIKVERDLGYNEFYEYENDNQIVQAKIRENADNSDSDFQPDYENEKQRDKKSKTNSKKRKKQVCKTESGPKINTSNKECKSDSAEKTKSSPKKKSKTRDENKEPLTVPKIKIKTEKGKTGNEDKLNDKKKRVLQVKKDGPVKIVVKGNKTVKIKQEKVEGGQSKSSPKKQKRVWKVVKPLNKNKHSCTHCKRKFPGHVFLRKHLLARHKQSFNEDWEFSRYLIKFYSGIRKYIENCIVDIRGQKNKYRCTKCKKLFKKYSLFCLHFQRVHMTKNPNFGGKYKFFLLSRKLKHLENFLRKVLEAKNKKDFKKKLKAKLKKREPKIKTEECEYCNKMFVNQCTLRAHQRHMHGSMVPPTRNKKLGVSGVRLFQCSMCEVEKYMVSQNSLQKHLKDFHKLDEETARMRSHEVPYQLSCEVISCGFKTNNILSMKTHVTYTHPFIQHPCTECKMVFQVRLLLERHKFQKHTPKDEESYSFMCAHCDKRFPKQFRLKVHEFYKHGVEHQDIKLYRCEEPGCQYVTASQSSLKVHGSKHVKEKRFVCEYCGMKLKTALSHQKHIKKMHLGIRPYLCQVCGQSFGEDHELKSHIRNKHTTEYEFKCDHCPYMTTNKGTFYTHLYNVHKVRAEDDHRKEFRCPHPGCKFVSILHHRYQTHINGHTDTRTYCCKPCNKWFVSSSTLRAHKQWYHSDKVHSCTQCNYQTKTSQKLNEHVRVQHQLKGLKPFKCPYCEFRCATGGNTRKHVKQVHRGQVVTYLRDDSLLTAAKMAKASGQNQPLINILPLEALNSTVPMSYPASAKKLGLVSDNAEVDQEMLNIPPAVSQEAKYSTIMQHVATKTEKGQVFSTKLEKVTASDAQVPEHANQLILAGNHIEAVSPPDPRTQGPVDIGAQVTVDIQGHLPQELQSRLTMELRNQINHPEIGSHLSQPELGNQITQPELHNQITKSEFHNRIVQPDIRSQPDLNQLTTDLQNQMAANLYTQAQTDLRNQIPVEQAMQLAAAGQQITFSTGHDYIALGSGGHQVPLSSQTLMPMIITPHVQVSVGSYEEVKDSSASANNLTMIG